MLTATTNHDYSGAAWPGLGLPQRSRGLDPLGGAHLLRWGSTGS